MKNLLIATFLLASSFAYSTQNSNKMKEEIKQEKEEARQWDRIESGKLSKEKDAKVMKGVKQKEKAENP